MIRKKTYCTFLFCGAVFLTVPFLLSSCAIIPEGEPGESLVGSEGRTAEGMASDAEMENQFAASVQMLWIRNGTFGQKHSAGFSGNTPSPRFRKMLADAGLTFGGTRDYVLEDLRKDGVRTMTLTGPDGKTVLKTQCRIGPAATGIKK